MTTQDRPESLGWGERRSYGPPSLTAVHRAAVDALAEHGHRQAGVTHVARLADTNRQYLYRNWRSLDDLFREATLSELDHVLDRAHELPDPLPPRCCVPVHKVVRAARLVREHPVVATLARTAPEVTFAAVLRPTTPWHDLAWRWLFACVAPRLPKGTETEPRLLAVLTAALPYALAPGGESDRAAADRRLSLTLHAVLGLPVPCPDCHAPRSPQGPGS